MMTYQRWPGIVFLFGAGASHLFGGPHRPPLLPGLIAPLQTAFPGSWGAIPEDSKAVFESDFEAAMDTYSSESDQLAELTKDAALFFSKFRPDGPKREPYSRLLTRYRNALVSGEMLISTLNYDCLIELCGDQIGVQTDYFNPGKGMRVLKLHGSSNFTVQHRNLTIGGKVTISKSGRVDFPIDDPPPSPSEVPDILAKCKFPPAMALMTPGKQILAGERQILRIQDEFKTAVSRAESVIVVGANPNFNDKHVWNPILDASGDAAYIGNKAKFAQLDTRRKPGKTHWLGARFEESLDELFEFVDRKQ